MQIRDAAPSYGAEVQAQEVPPGYKRTEVGVIPEDWETRTLRSCLNVPPRYGINAAAVSWNDSLPTYLRITDIGEDGRFRPSPQVSVKHSDAPNYHLNIGDLVFARTGASVGKSYLYDSQDGPLVFAGFLIRVTPDAAQLQPEFLAYCVQTKRYWDWVSTVSVRSGQPGINSHEYGTLLLPIPCHKEQCAIAETLSDVDGLLGALEALIAKKRAIKQAAMQQLLTGKTRLPGFGSNLGMAKTEIGEIPKEWSVVSLRNLVDPARGIRYGIVQPGMYDPAGRYMIRGQDYSEAKGWADPRDVFRVSPSIEEKYRNARVRHGDLIMTIVGYCGHVEMVPSWLDGANLTQTTARIAIKSGHDVADFCKYVLQSHIGKCQVTAYLKGAAQPGLNCTDVAQFLVCLPSRDEQRAIATVLSDMDAEITALEARRDKTRAIKQGMMQQLLTGRVRLVEIKGPVDSESSDGTGKRAEGFNP